MRYEFEYDEYKSQINKSKHGIDFIAAQELWLDEDLAEAEARSEDEQRFTAVGRIADKHWSAVFTYRNGRIRLISVRRARLQEVVMYEGK